MDATDGLYQLYDGQATTSLINGYLPFQTPTFLIQSGLANTANSIAETITGPCSPNKIGGDSFYQVFSQSPNASISYINMTIYGLGDELNYPPTVIAKSFLCDTCSNHPTFTCNYPQHQTDVAYLTGQFISGIFNQNQINLNIIQNPNTYISHVVNKYQLNGYNLTTQGAFCNHN